MRVITIRIPDRLFEIIYEQIQRKKVEAESQGLQYTLSSYVREALIDKSVKET